MCACHVVQSLAHPAHAVYLLRPVVLEIPESVAAWSVAGGRGNQLLDTESLVRAMRVFLPAGDTGFLQSEWFSVAEVRKQRSVAGWRAFADEVVQNHAFTRYWWSGQREGPFYLVQSSMSSMGEMITKLVQREMVGLSNALRREETAKAMQKLKRDREKRKWLAGLDEADNAKKAKPDSPSTPPFNKVSQGAKRKNPDPPSTFSSPSSNHSSASPPPKSNTLSSAAKQEISRLTYLHHTQHISILAQVQQALSSMGSAVFKAHFKHILCLIVSLGVSFFLLTGAIITGLYNLKGVILGGLILVALPEIADSLVSRIGESEGLTNSLPDLLVSALLILAVVFTPNGPGQILKRHHSK